MTRSQIDTEDYHKIFTSLIIEDESYSQDMTSCINVNESDMNKLSDEILELTSLGFSNTLNFRDLNELKSKYKSNKNNAESIDRYKELKRYYGCLIIPEDRFNKILSDNNLVVRTSSQYIGSIPVSVLEKSKNHVDKIRNDCSGLLRVPNKCIVRETVKYSRLNLFKSELKLVLNAIKNSVVFDGNYISFHHDMIEKIFLLNGYSKKHAERSATIVVRNISKMKINLLGKCDLLIACPESMSIPMVAKDNSVYNINMAQRELEKSRSLDPIIFQYTDLGVLVIDSWGKESHSEILSEHKDKLDLNDL